jgi:hypothetical protein
MKLHFNVVFLGNFLSSPFIWVIYNFIKKFYLRLFIQIIIKRKLRIERKIEITNIRSTYQWLKQNVRTSIFLRFNTIWWLTGWIFFRIDKWLPAISNLIIAFCNAYPRNRYTCNKPWENEKTDLYKLESRGIFLMPTINDNSCFSICCLENQLCLILYIPDR